MECEVHLQQMLQIFLPFPGPSCGGESQYVFGSFEEFLNAGNAEPVNQAGADSGLHTCANPGLGVDSGGQGTT